MPYSKGKRGKRSRSRGRSQGRPSYKRPSIRKSKGYDQLTVYANPWSTMTTNPKIPDGKCRLSTGLRLQGVREYINNGEGEMEFVIFPGLQAGLASNLEKSADNSEWEAHLRYENHGQLNVNAGPDTTEVVQPTGTAIAKWRLVSQAVRFTLVNNADENDGWFEAIRFSATNDYGKFRLQNDPTSPAPPQLTTFLGVAEPAYHDNIFAKIGNLVEHPSYVSGKLRDIHRYQFQLRPIDTDHDFRDMHRQYIIPNTAVQGDPEPGTNPPADQTSHEAEMLKNGCLDDSYDLIFLRIHGRTRTGQNPTRIMTHLVSNQEVMYEQGSAFSRYHSETDASPLFKALSLKMVEGNVKAAWKGKNR